MVNIFGPLKRSGFQGTQVLRVMAETIRTSLLTLWRPAAFGDFQKIKTPKRTWLCVGISLLLYGLRTWSKRQNTWQVF